MAKIVNIFLNEILTTINKINELLKEKTLEDFRSNYHIVEKVIKYLNFIGEASKQVPDEIKAQLSDVPWEDLSNLRNIENNPEHISLVWNMATTKLVEIQPVIENVVN